MVANLPQIKNLVFLPVRLDRVRGFGFCDLLCGPTVQSESGMPRVRALSDAS